MPTEESKEAIIKKIEKYILYSVDRSVTTYRLNDGLCLFDGGQLDDLKEEISQAYDRFIQKQIEGGKI